MINQACVIVPAPGAAVSRRSPRADLAAASSSASTASWPTSRVNTPDIIGNSSERLPTDTDQPSVSRQFRDLYPSFAHFRRLAGCTLSFRRVPADRYGGCVTTAATLPGRINAFVRWVVRTPWPVFSLSMLQADIIGGAVRAGLPALRAAAPRPHPAAGPAGAQRGRSSSSSVIVLFLAGFAWNLKLLVPVFRWQRRDNLLAEADPATTELARSRALRMPFYRTLISAASWCIGSAVFIVASWSVAHHAAPVVIGRQRAGRHRDRDHRLSAVRAGAAAGGGRRAAQRCAGERHRHPASSCG